MNQLIEELEKMTTVSEHDIFELIKKHIPENKDITFELHSEALAFSFTENLSEEKHSWNTYFKPMIIWQNEDGSITESPSIHQIDKKILDYWEKRSNETENPLLKARYTGLIWDFTKNVTGDKPEFNIGKTYIESLIAAVEGRFYHYEIELITKIKRAINIACSLNQTVLIKKAKELTLELEDEFSANDKINLWGFSFDYLINNKRVDLSDEETQKIIDKLNARFEKLTSNDFLNPWDAEYAAKRLCNYYKKNHQPEKIRIFLLQLGKAFSQKEANSSAIQIASWLRHLHKIYSNYGLREEADKIIVKLQELGPKINDELSLTKTPLNIPKDKMDGFVNLMTKGSKEEILNNIIQRFIPSKAEIKDHMFEMAKKAPLNYKLPITLQDHKGRIITTIGSIEDDIDGRLIMEFSENLTFDAIFLRHVFYKIVNEKLISTNDILDFIEKSPVIMESRFPLIERGLNAYFDDDLMVAIHLLIPQIEEAMRNLVEISGGVIFKPTRDNVGFQLKTFHEILGDKIVEAAFNEDIKIYMKVLFTDQRGWNIRNDVCHGICDINSFSYQSIERIIHVLLILGLLRKN